MKKYTYMLTKMIKCSLICLLFIGVLQSCRTKQKAVQRESIKTEAVINETFEDKSIETFIADKLETKKTILESETENKTEEIEADSTGVVTVQIKQTDSGTVKIYTGVKKIKVSNEKTATKQIDTIATKENINATKETESKKESVIKLDEEINKRSSWVKILATSTWFWILLVIVVIFFIWVNRKRLRFF